MPSKEPAKGLKPYTVFHVAVAAPEDIHIDTVLARSADDAHAIAADQHSDSNILHVRSLGETTHENESEVTCKPHTGIGALLPGARFINGRFLATHISDEPLLDSISE
ncbi:MAG: hypothetical protein ACTSV1_03770 [Alphaproteobacteria bacterium]